MGTPKRRRSPRAGRLPMRSPGRPTAGRREHRRRFWEAIACGLSSEEAALGAGVSQPVGTRWFRESGGMPPISLAPLSGRYLSFAEREEIAILHAQHCGVRDIARRISRSPSTISRELRRNAATRSGGLEYRATTAQWHADLKAEKTAGGEARCTRRTAPVRARPDSPAGLRPPTGRGCLVPMCTGTVAATGAVKTDAGRRHGVLSKLPTDSRSTSPMMSRCGSPTRPSTRRSTCRDEGHCDATWWRACGPAGRCACQEHGHEDAARRSSLPKS